MWWTITGNFGNILPIDWSKSYARQMHMPSLQLGQNQEQQHHQPQQHRNPPHRSSILKGCGRSDTLDDDLNDDLSSEDEAVANDLDMHALILGGSLHADNEPIKTAEEVIKEIDDIMDETTPSECGDDDAAMEMHHQSSAAMQKAKEVLGAPLFEESKCSVESIYLFFFFI